jgi:hypothetical protein
VNGAADSVSRQPLDHRESAATHLALDGTANLIHAHATACDRERCAKRRLGAGGQRVRSRAGGADDDAACRVCDVAVFLHGYIEFDDVAAGDTASAGNAMNDFIVDTDEDRSWKPVCEGRR